MDLIKFAKAVIQNINQTKPAGLSKKETAAAIGVGAGAGLATAPRYQFGKHVSKKEFAKMVKPGDIIMSGEYDPAGKFRLDLKGLKQEIAKGKGLRGKLQRAKAHLLDPAKTVFVKSVGPMTGTPYYHGSIVGKKIGGKRRIYEQIDKATQELLSSELYRSRVALFRPKGVTKAQRKKAVEVARAMAKKGGPYDISGAIIGGA